VGVTHPGPQRDYIPIHPGWRGASLGRTEEQSPHAGEDALIAPVVYDAGKKMLSQSVARALPASAAITRVAGVALAQFIFATGP
jgi:hypothetical protein